MGTNRFITNVTGVKTTYTCDDDCCQSGCPSHTMEIKIIGVADCGELWVDDKHIITLDGRAADTLEYLLNIIKDGK